ncbi:MAG: hypothetical protein JXB35_17110 [Anaerolineae bacterium]|nr:hypothetical protein [Anaerolineae bacterium]
MTGLNPKTHIVAGDPITIGNRKLTPSVMITTVEGGHATAGALFRGARIRPISVVEQGPEGNRWHIIPNKTQDTLSVMAGVALGVAVLSSLIILVARLLQGLHANGTKE